MNHNLIKPSKKIAILGATGHIGKISLAIAKECNIAIEALAASTNVDAMFKLSVTYQPKFVALSNEDAAKQLQEKLLAENINIKVLAGSIGIKEVAICDADTIVAAISGVAGVMPTMEAAIAGKKILLANKEAIVTAGKHMLAAINKHKAQLIPVDSEHGALLELLNFAKERKNEIKKVWLTASGGPFHESNLDINEYTLDLAKNHPVWTMGEKITIDSATLMNKGLEVIEASLLFDLNPSMIDVVVHPQSIVHALIDINDGGTIAHCANPDMRHPIARALFWPKPQEIKVTNIDWHNLGSLEFKAPDLKRFPCLRLANEALNQGGLAPAVLNAANEVAVNAFCQNNKVGFKDIPVIIQDTLNSIDGSDASFEDMIIADQKARSYAQKLISQEKY